MLCPGVILMCCPSHRWSTVERGDPYGFAKLGAERLVREHAKSKPDYDCVSINPVVVFGPCLTKAHTKASPSFLRDFLFGNKKPDAWATIVDVRDTAQAHIEALRREEVAGKRYIIARDDSAMRLSSMARQLQECCPEYKLSPRFVPGWQTALFLNWPWVVSALAVGGAAAVAAFTETEPAPTIAAAAVAVCVCALSFAKGPSVYLKKVLATEVQFSAERSKQELAPQTEHFRRATTRPFIP